MDETRNRSPTATVLDEVMYLASLATHPDELEPLMNTVRLITARLKTQHQPSPQDERELARVRSQLNDYLLSKEPVRIFTPESLQLSIREHFAKQDHRPAWQLAVIIAATILAGFGCMLLPIPDQNTKGALTSSIVIGVISAGAVFFFLSSLSVFKAGVRQAYHFIVAGVISTSLAQLVQPIINLVSSNTLDANNIKIGILIDVTIFILPGAALTYSGVRKYASKMGITGRLTSARLLMGLLLGIGIVSALLGFTVINDRWLGPSQVIQGCVMVMAILSAGIMRQIVSKTAFAYSRASRALFVSLLVNGITALYIYGFIPVYFIHSTSAVGFIPTSVMLLVAAIFCLRAGYYFAKASRF